MKKFLLVLPLLLACAQDPKAKSIVFLIGDGMGPSQVTLARAVEGTPALDDMPVTGFAKTPSSDCVVTDSAAGGTAMACGVKSYNGAIGVDAKGKAVETILEKYQKVGKSVGLVTTTTITHATPACFAAHVDSRAKEKLIAKEYLKIKPDVLLGGGYKQFDEDVLKAYADAGYGVARKLGDLKGDKWLGLFSDWHMPYVIDGVKDRPSLVDMTTRALEKLSANDKGFFLMVEGGRIDHACHVRDAAACVKEMAEFDATVKAVREFAAKRGDVLVVVTADHATGGLGLTAAFKKERFAAVTASAEAMVLEVAKAKDDREVLQKRLAGFGIKDADVEPVYRQLKGNPTEYDAQSRIGEILAPWLGVNFIPADYQDAVKDATHGHDGVMVPVYAFGPGAGRFTGTYENTDLPKRILEIVKP